MILGWFWGDFYDCVMILRWFWDGFGIFWDGFVMIVWWFLDGFGMILGWCLDDFWMVWDDLGMILGWFWWYGLGMILGCWPNFGIICLMILIKNQLKIRKKGGDRGPKRTLSQVMSDEAAYQAEVRRRMDVHYYLFILGSKPFKKQFFWNIIPTRKKWKNVKLKKSQAIFEIFFTQKSDFFHRTWHRKICLLSFYNGVNRRFRRF